MDLSKDIMMDLGITVIGDIIAILKHAKQVYRQVRPNSMLWNYKTMEMIQCERNNLKLYRRRLYCVQHVSHDYMHLQDMCKMATEAISSGQTSVQAELRRTANTRK